MFSLFMTLIVASLVVSAICFLLSFGLVVAGESLATLWITLRSPHD